ncbi:hemerythrin domain-containing protein [Micromonospora sp. LZ34]
MPNDAIELLTAEHDKMRKLFQAFEESGDGSTKKRGEVVQQIVQALTAHSYIEEECMYPATRMMLPDLEADVLQAFEEHHLVDVLCFELAGMTPQDENFDAKAMVLITTTLQHIEEEEQVFFPAVREGLTGEQLQDLGNQLAELRRNAPTKPSQPRVLKGA